MFRFEPANRLRISCMSDTKFPIAEGININAQELQKQPVTSTTPQAGDALIYQNGEWVVSTYVPPTVYYYGTDNEIIAVDSTTFSTSITYATTFNNPPVLIIDVTGDSTFYTRTTSSQIKITNETTMGFDIEISGITVLGIYLAFNTGGGSLAYELSDNSVAIADQTGFASGLGFRRSNTAPVASQTWSLVRANTASTGGGGVTFIANSDRTLLYCFGSSSNDALFFPGIGRYDVTTDTYTQYEPALPVTPGTLAIVYTKYSVLIRPDGTVVFVWYQRTGANPNYSIFYATGSVNGTSWVSNSLSLNQSFIYGPWSAQVEFGGVTYSAIGYNRNPAGVPLEIRISTGIWPAASVILTPTATATAEHNMFYFDKLTAPKLAFFSTNTTLLVSTDPIGTGLVSHPWSIDLTTTVNLIGEIDEWSDGRLYLIYYNVAANVMRYAEINKTTWTPENTVDLFTPAVAPLAKGITNYINTAGNLVVIFRGNIPRNTYYYEQSPPPTPVTINYMVTNQ